MSMEKKADRAMELRNQVVDGLSNRTLTQDLNLDLMEHLDKNDRIFREKMNRIFIKYNQPFENDYIVDIQSLTYETSEGPREWNGISTFRTKKAKYKKRSEKKIQETEDKVVKGNETYILPGGSDSGYHHINHTQLDVSEVLDHNENVNSCNKTFVVSGENSITCSPEKTFKNDMLLGKKYIADVDLIVRWNESVIPKTYAIERTNQMTIKYSPVKNSLRSPYPDASKKDCLEELEPISPKAEYSIMSPLKVSISSQVKRFFGRHHKSRSLDCTGSSEQTAACKERYETDHEFADDEDSNFSDSWNVSFANFYPQKIEYLSRLMEIPCKKQAATNILRYYRRHVWCAKKQKLNLKREIHKAKNVRRLTSLKADDGKSLCTINLKTKKLVETHVLHNSGIAESGENGIHSRYTNVTPKFKNAKTENLQVSVLSQTFTLSPEKTFICNPSTVSTRPKGSIKCDFLSSNPHTSLAALTENSQTGRSPSNLPSLPWLNQRQQKNERILKVQKWLNSMEKAEEPKEMQRTLKRRHSFSSFPVVKSPAKNCLTYESSFEAVYRKLVLQDPQQRTLHKGRNINLITQTHVSQTLSALINSPMSYRAKRVAGDDFMCLSKLKRHRTMIEPLIPDVSSLESKYMKNYNSYSTTASLPQLNADWSVGLCNKNDQRPYLAENPILPNQTIAVSPRLSGAVNQYDHSPMSQTCSSTKIHERANLSIYRKLTYK